MHLGMLAYLGYCLLARCLQGLTDEDKIEGARAEHAVELEVVHV